MKGNTMLPHQFNALSLKDQASTIKQLRALFVENRAKAKIAKAATRAELKEAKAANKAEKQAAAIAKAQARLQKLLDKQAALVGVKALKANRKPSKAVVTYGAEANQIAAAIMAKKAGA